MNHHAAFVLADDADEQVVVPRWNTADWLVSAAGDKDVVKAEVTEPAAAVAIVYPLNRLGNVALQRVMVVSVERDAADVVMSNGRLRIWGVGDSIHEALEDFSRTFTEVLRSYQETPADQMSQGAIAYLDELRSYLA